MPRRYHSVQHSVTACLLSNGMLLTLLLTFSQAQMPSAITSDGTLGSRVAHSDNVYTITGGTRPGNGPNLFHSFARFSIGTNDIARFSAPSSGIAHILSRVTGGERSVIDGRLESTLPGAHFYLINPSGVLFGPNASLDVKGSFHISTADYLRLADGGMFAATLSAKSTLTVAPPVAFGFLREHPAGIAMQGSSLTVPEHETLSLIAGDFEMRGGLLRAPSGQIHLRSVASPGESTAGLPGDTPDMPAPTFAQLGSMHLFDGALINAGGNGGGSITIQGGRLMMEGSGVFASTTGPSTGPLHEAPGRGIDIHLSEDMVLDNAIVGTNVLTNVAAGVGSGGVRVRARLLDIHHGGELQSIVFLRSTGGKGGDIAVEAQSLLLRDRGLIRAVTGGAGDGAEVNIHTEDLELRDGGTLFTQAFNGTGNGGNITVHAERLRLANNNPGSSLAGISANTLSAATGKAGNVQVTVDDLHIVGERGAEISSFTLGVGQGGDVEVNAKNIAITGSSDPTIFTGIFANTFASGSGGQLRVQAENIQLTHHASFQASSIGTEGGAAGGATINVREGLALRDGAFISTSGLFGTGDAADLNITAKDISIVGSGDSNTNFTGFSSTTNTGRGGNLQVTANSLHIADKGRVTAATHGTGHSGNLTIRVHGRLVLMNGGQITAATSDSGHGGSIEVAAESILLSGINNVPEMVRGIVSLLGSAISVQTLLGSGNAGDIRLTATSVQVLDGAAIDATTLGQGDGGTIQVHADRVVVSGINTTAQEHEAVRGSLLARSILSTGASSFFTTDGVTGKAGNLTIQAREVQIVDGGLVTGTTTGTGAGGDLTIKAAQVTLASNGRVESRSSVSPQAGKAGNITIIAHETFQSTGGSVSTAAEQAEGGTITIQAPQVLLRQGSVVSAQSSGSGNAGRLSLTAAETLQHDNSRVTTAAAQARGGDISIAAPQLSLTNTAVVSAESTGPGQAGSVRLTATETLRSDHSQVTTAATQGQGGDITLTAPQLHLSNTTVVSAASTGPGNAGNIHLTAIETFQSTGSTVTTEATQADGGNITVQAQKLVRLRDSQITATVGGGSETVGGNIRIDPEAVVLERSQIAAQAFEGRGGNIRISAGVLLADPASAVSASSTRGINGAVDIRAPIANLSGDLVALPQRFGQEAALLQDHCAARLQEGHVSSLVVREREGTPAAPDGVLPSRPYTSAPQGKHATGGKQTRRQRRTTPGATEAVPALQTMDMAFPGTAQAWDIACAPRSGQAHSTR